MIGFPAGVRVHLAVEPHDMRKSFNGLTALARELVSRGLEDGAMFAFTNKRRNRLKILYYDRTGVCVLAKRLEAGTFSWPKASSAGSPSLSLAPEALQLLLDGIDLRGAKMRPWYERREPAEKDPPKVAIVLAMGGSRAMTNASNPRSKSSRARRGKSSFSSRRSIF